MLNSKYSPIIFGVIVGVIMLILSYLDSKISNRETSKITYIKIFLSSALTSGGIKYLFDNYLCKTKVKQQGGDENIVENIKKSIKVKDVYTDMPNW